MPHSPVPEPLWLFAGALLLPMAVAALLALLVRAAGRERRHAQRLRAGDLYRLFAARVAGRIETAELKRALGHAGHDECWQAIEAVATTLRPHERRLLARGLARCPQVVTERRALREHGSAERRELAARRLGALPEHRSRRALRRALVTGTDAVAFAAARALARHRDLRALGWVLAHPRRFASRPVSALSGMLRAFGPRGRAQALAALERQLTGRLACGALDALGLTGCRSARHAMASRLHDPDAEVRVAAARALGRLGMGEAIPALTQALDDRAWPVRAIAAQALGRLLATPAIEPLVARLGDRDEWVRHHAAHALAAIGGEAHDALLEVAVASPDAEARLLARAALDTVGLARHA